MVAAREKKHRMSAVPVQKPIIIAQPKPNLRVAEKSRPATRTAALGRFAGLVALMLGTFFVSSMVGQVALEKTRREGIRISARANEAARSESQLRDEILDLKQPSAVDAWAQENGYVPPERLAALMAKGNGSEQGEQ